MEEFLSLASSKLGLSADQSASSTSALLGVLKDKLPMGDFAGLAAKIPGLSNMAEQEAGAEAGGGLLGGLASSASSLLGGSSAIDLLGKLQGSGLSLDSIPSFVGLFSNFIKDKAGDSMFETILSNVPDLKKFL